MVQVLWRSSSRGRAGSQSLGLTVLGLLVVMFPLVACSLPGSSSGADANQTILLAAVDNPQMEDLQKLIPEFESTHPHIHVRVKILPEWNLRKQITQDVTTKTGLYDVFMIGTYEVSAWARNGWIQDLSPYVSQNPSYDSGDLISGVSRALSVNSSLYAVPFYGESSMLMYRKDMLAAKGISLPDHPTWDQVATAAKAVNDPAKGLAGICLRGLPSWGDSMAAIDTVVNTYGGRWYDMGWHAQLTSQQFKAAVTFYTDLVKAAGEPNPTTYSFDQCLAAYNAGKVAMWYDATVGASNFTDAVAQSSGYAYAPVKDSGTAYSGWLWAWALALPSTGTKKDAAWAFVSWATSKDYVKLVARQLGWSHVPPGTRTSTYQTPDYQKVAGGFAQITLDSIAHADVNHPTVDQVPYSGIQYVAIPEFQDLGDQVAQQIAGVMTGSETVDQAMDRSQQLADGVGAKYRK